MPRFNGPWIFYLTQEVAVNLPTAGQTIHGTVIGLLARDRLRVEVNHPDAASQRATLEVPVSWCRPWHAAEQTRQANMPNTPNTPNAPTDLA